MVPPPGAAQASSGASSGLSALSVTLLRAFSESYLWPVALLIGLVGLVGLQSVRLWVERRRPRWRLARHRRLGRQGEELAERLLEDDGYRVEGRQVTSRYTLLVDGEPKEVVLRADFVVRLGSRRFVAEAKAGELAGRLETAATRRQLVEYCLAFDVEGVLLVDTHRRCISLVQLQRPAPSGSLWPLVVLVVGAALVLIALWATLVP